MLSFIAERADEDAPALVRPGGETMTYATLAMAAAAVMQALGERVGEVAHRLVGVAVDEGAAFVASVLGVLEAGGVVLPLDLRRGIPALELEAARARALAVVVGDAAADRLEVVAVDASRRQLAEEACLVLDAGGRRAVHSRAGLGLAVDAIARQVGLDAGLAAGAHRRAGARLDADDGAGDLARRRDAARRRRAGARGAARALGVLGATVVAAPADALAGLASPTVARVVVVGDRRRRGAGGRVSLGADRARARHRRGAARRRGRRRRPLAALPGVECAARR